MIMEVKEFTESLQSSLSEESKILNDQQDSEFKEALSRWSNIDLKIPGAIIQPATEADAVATVKAALKASIPFVPATGGHSPWSTINEKGFILDLRLYKDVIVDAANRTVTIKGGLQMKELQVALSAQNQFTCVSNGSTVGCIPFFLNGGLSTYSPLLGYGSSQILSATLLTASGTIVTASPTSKPDLLWALRGAGQFFGLVLSLTLRTHPFSLLGNPTGARLVNTFVFPPSSAPSLFPLLLPLLSDPSHVSWGQLTLTTSPAPPHGQVLLLTIHTLTPSTPTPLAPLLALQPLSHTVTHPTFATHSDALDWTCAHGDFKSYTQIGLTSPVLPQENFLALLPLHENLLTTSPGMGKCALSLTFSSPRVTLPLTEAEAPTETAFGNADVNFWFAVLTWYTDPKLHAKMEGFAREARGCMRRGTEVEGFVSYTNNTREDPVEWRYKGGERLERLRRLKREWDAKGCFSRELL